MFSAICSQPYSRQSKHRFSNLLSLAIFLPYLGDVMFLICSALRLICCCSIWGFLYTLLGFNCFFISQVRATEPCLSASELCRQITFDGGSLALHPLHSFSVPHFPNLISITVLQALISFVSGLSSYFFSPRDACMHTLICFYILSYRKGSALYLDCSLFNHMS